MLLSARRVGPTGLAYGLDMTDEMLDLARRNQAEAGVTNVQWLRGHIEEIPLPKRVRRGPCGASYPRRNSLPGDPPRP